MDTLTLCSSPAPFTRLHSMYCTVIDSLLAYRLLFLAFEWMNLHHSTLLVKFLRVFAALNPSNFQGNWSLHEMKIVQRTNQVFENYHLRGGGELKGFWLCHDKNYLIPYKALWYSYEQHPHLHYPSILCWSPQPSLPPPPPHTHNPPPPPRAITTLRLVSN